MSNKITERVLCTGSTNCWCSNLKIELDIHSGYDLCLSPSQILVLYKDKLCLEDKEYLEKLAALPFEY